MSSLACALWIVAIFSLSSILQLCQCFTITKPSPTTVLCIGEALFDSLPSGIYLGGGPTNVAIHLTFLGTPTAIATCVGKDRLGDECIRRLSNFNVQTNLIQRHDSVSTGMVIAAIDDRTGDATYEFDTPAAWDYLSVSDELVKAVGAAKVIVLGTIASRLGDETTFASTIRTIRSKASQDQIVLDLNLREPWYDPAFVLELAKEGNELALLKLNDEELNVVEDWCDFEADDRSTLQQRMKNLGEALNAKRVCVTHGENGAALWCRSSDQDVYVEQHGFSFQNQEQTDTIGAGDSFLAALIKSLLLEKELPQSALEKGCALGAYVAGCSGAVPDHGDAPKELRDIFSFS